MTAILARADRSYGCHTHGHVYGQVGQLRGQTWVEVCAMLIWIGPSANALVPADRKYLKAVDRHGEAPRQGSGKTVKRQGKR